MLPLKLLHPDFARPNRKPLGPITIDESNPHINTLVGAFLGGRGKSFNHAYAKSWKSAGHLSHFASGNNIRIEEGIPCWYGDGTGGSYFALLKTTSDSDYNHPWNPGTSDYCIFFRGKIDGINSSIFCSLNSSLDDHFYVGINSSGYATVSNTNGGAETPTKTDTVDITGDDQFHTILAARINNHTVALWVDDRYIGSNTNVSGSSSCQVDLSRIGSGNPVAGMTADKFEGVIDCVYVWRGRPSASYSKIYHDLISDRYQIFRPAGPQWGAYSIVSIPTGQPLSAYIPSKHHILRTKTL